MKKFTVVAALAAVGIAALVAVQVAGASGSPKKAADPPAECQLGNSVQHVINIVFDNVHFSRDNPNVPSDLEQMPHLLNFLNRTAPCFRTRTPR